MDVQTAVLGLPQEPLRYEEPKGDGYDEVDAYGHLHDIVSLFLTPTTCPAEIHLLSNP